MNHWFTSDTHYGHKNIVRGTTSWTTSELKESKQKGGSHQGVRNFDTLEEHNLALVSIINRSVKSDDILWHLGDWSFGGKDNIEIFRNQLNCKNINLIFGNHDQHIEPENSIYRKLFNSVQYYKELNINKTKFVMSHYAMRVWNQSHYGSIMLYGHSHGTLDELTPQLANPTWIGDQYYIKNYKTMDVGVDTNHLEPYHLDQIREIMNQKEVLLNIDHHSEETN